MKRFVIEVEVPEPQGGLCSGLCAGLVLRKRFACKFGIAAVVGGAFIKPGSRCPRHPDYVAPVDRLAEATEILADMVTCVESGCQHCAIYGGCEEAGEPIDRARRFLEELNIEAALKAAKGVTS